MRVTARLIETAGETQLWAESYDRHLTHCLTVQTDVAAQIARALAADWCPTQPARTSTAASAAYQAYLKGRYFWNKTEDQAIDQAIAFYQEALTLDAVVRPGRRGAGPCPRRARANTISSAAARAGLGARRREARARD